jgi:tRNA 2-selenouridine synthase
MTEIQPQEFLNQALLKPVVDVRSPAEYAQGHIPGAINLPLFSDEERALVGTAYKKSGRSQAFDLGLDLVGPKMSGFVKAARELAPQKEILLHCWRGRYAKCLHGLAAGNGRLPDQCAERRLQGLPLAYT